MYPFISRELKVGRHQ